MTSPETATPAPTSNAGWGDALSLLLLAGGLAIVAVIVLLPAVAENRALAAERYRLASRVDFAGRQASLQQTFLERLPDDPTLLERLARRQLNLRPDDAKPIEMTHAADPFEKSPFRLLAAAVPTPAEPVSTATSADVWIGRLNLPRLRLWAIGAGMVLVAAGLLTDGRRAA